MANGWYPITKRNSFMEKGGVIKIVKDILFPIFCVDCGVEGSFCCDDCLANFKQNKIIKIDFRLKKQVRAVYLDNLTALFDYKKNLYIQKLIHLFKYEYCEEVGDIWQNFYKMFLDFNTHYDFIIPVPLHQRRLKERGFNQSEVLANKLYEEFCIYNSKVILNTRDLKRIRYTTQQIHLGGEKRAENLQNAFAWSGGDLIGKKILLVDDVYTTGATLNESAKVLKNVGACQVDCLVLAKD